MHQPARVFSALLLFALVGCVSRADVNRATFALEAAWQNDYEAVLDEDGIRRYALPRAEAFDALHAAAKRMRMVVRQVDEKRGFIMLAALAPTPLSQAEWESVYEMELPRMRKIISEEIGPLSSAMFVMRPENFELRLTMAVRASAPRSSTVGLHCRMERIAGYGANVTYPPPFAAKMGMDKLWAAFEQVLRERGLPVVREGVDEDTREELRA